MSDRSFDDPELEERRLAALRQIRQFGDPALRSPAAPIATFDAALREEAERMVAIMGDARGVGLAAPQLGSLRRLIVARPGEEEDAVALANPVVAWSSDDEEVDVEGCLSLGEITVDVLRPTSVRIEAQSVDGDAVEIEADGFAARVLLHEIDHLDGVLILDRVDAEQRRAALRELRSGSAAA
ncbi:MAG: peptide deformylase [Miltoncostaeaceae bacterium]